MKIKIKTIFKLLQPILQHTAAASSGFIINLKQLKPEGKPLVLL